MATEKATEKATDAGKQQAAKSKRSGPRFDIYLYAPDGEKLTSVVLMKKKLGIMTPVETQAADAADEAAGDADEAADAADAAAPEEEADQEAAEGDEWADEMADEGTEDKEGAQLDESAEADEAPAPGADKAASEEVEPEAMEE